MITRTLDRFKNKEPDAVQVKSQGGKYIKSTIYGGLDGIITTFAVVAGVAGASLSSGIVLILGLANLLADGLSMAIGDFLSTRAESEYGESRKKEEEETLKVNPETIQGQIEHLYMEKGVAAEDARALTKILAKYEDLWLSTVMFEKYGVAEEKESPIINAIVTFTSFCLFGFMPLLAYILALFIPALSMHTFQAACTLTAVTLFILGMQKVRFTKTSWFFSGLEMLLIGGVAAFVAYGIGVLLSGIA